MEKSNVFYIGYKTKKKKNQKRQAKNPPKPGFKNRR